MSSPGRARRMKARGQEPRQQGPLVVAAWPGSFGDVLRNIRRSGNCRAADPGSLALQATLDLVEVLLAVRGAERVDRAARRGIRGQELVLQPGHPRVGCLGGGDGQPSGRTWRQRE